GYAPQNPSNEDLGSWVLTVFLTMIPLVNIVYLLVLAFGDNTSIAKANFARATLIWTAVGIAVSIIFAVLLATAGVSIITEVRSGYAPQTPSNEDLGSWVLTVFLTMIPLVNIVYLLVLAFGDNTSIAKANFARATLIWTAVGIAVSIIFAVLLATAGVSIINEVLNEQSNEFNH